MSDDEPVGCDQCLDGYVETRVIVADEAGTETMVVYGLTCCTCLAGRRIAYGIPDDD